MDSASNWPQLLLIQQEIAKKTVFEIRDLSKNLR